MPVVSIGTLKRAQIAAARRPILRPISSDFAITPACRPKTRAIKRPNGAFLAEFNKRVLAWCRYWSQKTVIEGGWNWRARRQTSPGLRKIST
jgi:hypothetical protein